MVEPLGAPPAAGDPYAVVVAQRDYYATLIKAAAAECDRTISECRSYRSGYGRGAYELAARIRETLGGEAQ